MRTDRQICKGDFSGIHGENVCQCDQCRTRPIPVLTNEEEAEGARLERLASRERIREATGVGAGKVTCETCAAPITQRWIPAHTERDGNDEDGAQVAVAGHWTAYRICAACADNIPDPLADTTALLATEQVTCSLCGRPCDRATATRLIGLGATPNGWECAECDANHSDPDYVRDHTIETEVARGLPMDRED